LKILFYCSEYPPAKNGGIGTVTKIVAESLVILGHKVFVAGSYSSLHQYFGKGKHPGYQCVNGVEVYSLFHFNYLRLFKGTGKKVIRKLFKWFWIEDILARKAIYKVEKFIKKLVIRENIDIIEFPDFYDLLASVKGGIRLRKFNVPTVLRVHGSNSFLHYYRNGIIPEDIRKNDTSHFLRCDLALSVSNFSKSFVSQEMHIKIKNKVVYNPLEDSFFNNAPVNSKSNDILFFGTASEVKGIFSLFKAFNRVAEVFPEARLVVAGDADIEKAKAFLSAVVFPRVIFKGFMLREKLMYEIRNAYLCVLPSYYENFSLAALEVLANRRTLIHTNRCSGPEVIENYKNGILVDPDNDLEIADAIIYLFNNPDINEKLAEQGYVDCKNRFSATQIVKQLVKEYELLILNNRTIITYG
jgi:glycosyltransferase involved in cell wall biosynthesis